MKPITVPLVAALALLGSAPSFAQSSVGLSGWLDLGVSKKTGTPVQVGTLGRSNLAFAGREDLGGGLAAVFRLSTRFDLDTGTTEASDAQRPFWKDEATVGLKGGFGTLRLGRALTPLWSQSWAFDGWDNFDRIASPHWWQFVPDYLSGAETRDYARLNNGIFYDTPEFGGFSGHFSASPEKPATELARPVSASLNYARDGWSAMLAAERNSQKDKAGFIGLGATLGGIRWLASYSHVKLNPEGAIFGPAWTNWAGASEKHAKRTSFNLSALRSFGAHTLKAGVGRDFQGSTNGFNYIGSSFDRAGTGFSGPSTIASVGYVYAFSKRTSAVADVSRTRWKTEDDQGRRSAGGYAVGITHAF